MANSPLLELLTDQLRDLYDAEKQLTKALPRLGRAAADKELKETFLKHASETQGQVQRIEEIFQTLGTKLRGKPCAAMKGLVQEAQEVISGDIEKSVRDLALIASARRVEHYEMAAYDGVISAVQASKKNEVLALLKQTAAEEATADKLLTGIAKRLLKEAAKPAAAPPESKGSGSSSGTNGNKAAGKRASGNGRGSNSGTTIDHQEIQSWAEERGGKPACVQGTGDKGDIGLLRIEFPGKPNAKDDKLTEISWEDFFGKFDERGLALVYQNTTANGQKSNFNKLVARETGAKGKAARR